jgi:myosin heavy subunit
MDEMKETHRGNGAAYWEWLKDQAVRRALVGEGGDVTRTRHLFPVTKHGRKEHELNTPRGTMGDWLKKYTHLVNQAPAPTTPPPGSAANTVKTSTDKTPYSELRRRIADLEGELQRQGVQYQKEIADLKDTNGGLRGQLDRRDPDRGEESDDSELKKAREESAKWKQKYEESIPRLQRAEEERNEAEHKAYNLEVDVEEKDAEIAKLKKSQERLLKDTKSKEEEVEAQKKWVHENQPSEADQKLEEERDEAVSAAQQLKGELLTYHSTHAKPRQDELATPKRTVDELGLGQYSANKRQKAASPLPEVDFSDAVEDEPQPLSYSLLTS